METNYSSILPMEMWINIFSYLPIQDQYAVRLVSYNFMELMDNRFMRQYILKITKNNIDAIKAQIVNQTIDKKFFKKLQISKVAFDDNLLVVLGATSEHVNYLKIIKNSFITFRIKLFIDGILCPNIDSLLLREIPCSDIKWINVFNKYINLRSLSLTECPKDWLTMIFTNLPKETPLQEIELIYTDIDNMQFQYILEKWKESLSAITLVKCSHISNESIIDLLKLCNLRKVKISFCFRIYAPGILNGFAARKNTIMEELELSHITGLNEMCITLMASRFINLKTLKLNDLPKAITNDSLAGILRCQRNLRVLCLDYAKITDEGLIGFGDNPYPIKLLRHLEELSLLHCPNLTNRFLCEALNFPLLRKFNLNECNSLTIEGIRSLVMNCPSLEILGIPGQILMDENAVQLIKNGLESLEILDIYEYYKATEEHNNLIKVNIGQLPNNIITNFHSWVW